MKYENYQRKQITVLKAILKSVAIFLLCVAVFVICLMFYCNNFLNYYPVQGGSMRPLLNEFTESGDYAYATKSAQNIGYGDIVIYNKNQQTLVIKRVIAMENDNIMIKDDGNGYAIYLQYKSVGDWKKLNEDYIVDKSIYEQLHEKFYGTNPYDSETHISESEFSVDESGNKYYHIKSGKIFYAGDNRLNSVDCFNYGAVTAENLVGKVVYIIHGNQLRFWQVLIQFLGFYKWK